MGRENFCELVGGSGKTNVEKPVLNNIECLDVSSGPLSQKIRHTIELSDFWSKDINLFLFSYLLPHPWTVNT